MLLKYEEMPLTSKVLIYQSSRKFYGEEVKEISSLVEDFIKLWHNNEDKIVSSYTLKYDRFIIILIDEDKIKDGLTVDVINNCVEFIVSLEHKYSITLLDTMNVCFKQGKYVQYKEIKEFKKLIKNKGVSKNTIVFNNLVNSKEEFENTWEVPLINSWHSRYL